MGIMNRCPSTSDPRMLGSLRWRERETRARTSRGRQYTGSDLQRADEYMCLSRALHVYPSPHEVKPPTGEPDAGNPPVRFGGRGGDEPSLPLSNVTSLRAALTSFRQSLSRNPEDLHKTQELILKGYSKNLVLMCSGGKMPVRCINRRNIRCLSMETAGGGRTCRPHLFGSCAGRSDEFESSPPRG